MEKIYSRILFMIGLAWLFQSCAVKVTPVGGVADKTPPKVLRSEPPNSSPDFKGKKFTITFDEFVQLKELNSQLIVSPVLNEDPDVSVRGKSIVFQTTDTLKENTTYTVSFGNSIVDVHEANVLEDYKFVFATGSFVDSLYVSGTVLNAKNLAPEKGVLVMLYTNDFDSVPMKEKPVYFSRTDASGKFRIEHVAATSYRIFVLKDKNANYLYDQPNEQIAFGDSLVDSSVKSEQKLMLFSEEQYRQHILRSSYEKPGKVSLAFKNPPEQLRIRSQKTAEEISGWDIKEKNATGDTITFWFSKTEGDTLFWLVSAEGMQTDTLELRMQKNDTRAGRGTIQSNKLLAISNISGTLDLNKKTEITFSRPLAKVDTAFIQIKADSLRVHDYSISFIDDAKRKTKLDFIPLEKTNYSVLMLPGAFTDMFGIVNDTIRLDFKTKSLNDYGNLALTLTLPDSKQDPVILQLLDEKEILVKEDYLGSSGKIKYGFLIPGKYKLRMIYDRNKNKKWDTGKYLQHLQPETVLNYPEIITIRADWEVEQEWKP